MASQRRVAVVPLITVLSSGGRTMEVRSERSTGHSSGEIRAFWLGYSLREQPPSLCHSKQAGHCSSSLCSEGSPPSKVMVTQVTRCGVQRATAADGTIWAQRRMVKLCELFLGLCKCLWQLPEVLMSMWKTTQSQETSHTVCSSKNTNNTKENLCKEERTWKILRKRWT